MFFLGYDSNFNSDVHSPCKFQKVYMYLKAMNDEFINRCKLFIGIDRCLIKGPYRGVLLSIMELDAYCCNPFLGLP
jgi:hypothetical protein